MTTTPSATLPTFRALPQPPSVGPPYIPLSGTPSYVNRTNTTEVAPGGGRIMQCIANRAADLSLACKEVLVPFMAR